MIASDVEKRLAAAVEKVAPGAGVALALGPAKEAKHGDFATPVAMGLAKALKQAPLKIADQIKTALLADPDARKVIAKADVAPPGFLNLTLSDEFWSSRLRDVLRDGEAFGRSDVGKGRKVLVEFVSANPTGPLHVGHARNAVIGDTLARLLEASGHLVGREFYVNDAGAQMANLGRSVWYRYAELAGKAKFPEALPKRENDEIEKLPPAEKRKYERFAGLYYGDYVKELAAAFREKEGDRWLAARDEDGVPEPSPEAMNAARDFSKPRIMDEQKTTLEQYGVRFDRWFSEQSLYDGKLVEKAVERLTASGATYEKDGALWFTAKKFGDQEDRVIRKSKGGWTYAMPDIAYHGDKLARGWQVLIDVWGADHHGYIPRIRAAMKALGLDEKSFDVVLIQMVQLVKDGREVKMSKRSGSFVTLREVIDEVGPDAARYLMLVRSADSGLEFDLDLAKKQSNDNPVFYVQYGHARVCSVFAIAAERGVTPDPAKADLSRLTGPEEREIVKRLARFPDEIAFAAERHEPHRMAIYLRELVAAFHSYYSKKEAGKPVYRIVSEDAALTQARLALAAATRTVLANGLALCGVSAPTKMTRMTEDADQDA